MECNRAKELLQDLVDDRLSESDRSAVLIHLDQCEGCTQEWYEWLALRALLRRKQPIAHGIDFRKAVTKASWLRSSVRVSRFKRRMWIASTGLTTTLVAVIILGFVFALNPAPRPQRTLKALNTDAAVSYHAVMRGGGVGVDIAKVHYAMVLGNMRDLAEDGTFEVD